MTDSFFGFDASSLSAREQNFTEEEDDTEYDALNSETFGEDNQSTNWEEVHEQLTSGLRAQSTQLLDEDNNDLSERIASFILDDENEDYFESKLVKAEDPDGKAEANVSRPSESALWWGQGHEQIQQRMHPDSSIQASLPSSSWWQDVNRPSKQFISPQPNSMAPRALPPRILTVEELERNIRQETQSRTSHQPSPPTNIPHDLPATVGRDQIQNGQFVRARPTPPNGDQQNVQIAMSRPFPPFVIGPRGRYAYHEETPDSYHGIPNVIPQSVFPRGHRGHHLQRGQHAQHSPHSQNNQHYAQQNLGAISRHPRPIYPRQMADQRYMVPLGPRRPPRNDYPSYNQPQRDHHPFHHVAQQGGYNQAAPPIPVDEYAGLMSPQEKQWLSSIQMMQLNSTNPLQDDFYYIMYQQRQQGNSARKLGTHGLKNNREVSNAKPASTYTPLQFENSLGKLQIGSVTAPRIIIDMDLVENVDSNHKNVERKSKQVLMEIEEICNATLVMESVMNPQYQLLAGSSVPKPKVDVVAIQDKVISIISGSNKLVQIMSIRKGRKAMLRLLPLLLNNNLLVLLHRLLLDLVPIMKKDTEQLLLSFLPAIRNYLASLSLQSIVDFTKLYETKFLLSNKLMMSVMANMLERSINLLEENVDDKIRQEWIDFLIRLAKATDNWSESERPVVAIERQALVRHLTIISHAASELQISLLVRALSNPSSNLQNSAPATDP